MKLYKERRVITRDNGQPYLIRWYIINTSLFGVMLHKIISSDHECPHDHPWNFISIILKGGYVEYVEKVCAVGEAGTNYRPETNEVVKTTSRIYHPGQILFRKAEHRHRLEIHKPCWTFVVKFKGRRKWGFWTRKGWIHWKLFSEANNCD